jgi:excinuclease ABC subunit C
VSSSERVFLPNRKNPVLLQPNSPEWLLMTRIRDEAHRTAVTFHRSVRTRETMTGTLERIGGVGPTRRKALLSHFGSMRAIRAASLAELATAPGVDVRTAQRIYMHFHPDEVQLDPEAST